MPSMRLFEILLLQGVKKKFLYHLGCNGQDDLIWHKAAKQMDGSYRVAIKAVDHKGEAGNYRAGYLYC